jgi:hypothetical protein
MIPIPEHYHYSSSQIVVRHSKKNTVRTIDSSRQNQSHPTIPFKADSKNTTKPPLQLLFLAVPVPCQKIGWHLNPPGPKHKTNFQITSAAHEKKR